MKSGCMRAKKESGKDMNMAVINRRCGTNIVYGMKDISVINERPFMKFTT